MLSQNCWGITGWHIADHKTFEGLAHLSHQIQVVNITQE
jgi:hypothetical protein